MAKLTSLLQQRFRKKEKPKMAELAEKTSGGSLTVFSGVFGVKGLPQKDQDELSEILRKYADAEEADLTEDLKALIYITSEVKAITNQAALLHGERIQKAQGILKKYREGAFTAWLMSTYGNRQTPYNFLQYFEFYHLIPKNLHTSLEAMPRQAIYTLASRSGEFEKKEEIVRSWSGEGKEELISKIRLTFPLEEFDKRKENFFEGSFKTLKKAVEIYENHQIKLTQTQKLSLLQLIKKLNTLITQTETYDA